MRLLCILSWYADQSGLIANGTAPRFSLCSDGMNWFQSRGKWQGSTYQPSAGLLGNGMELRYSMSFLCFRWQS